MGLRNLFALVPLGLMLAQQPFMMKPKLAEGFNTTARGLLTPFEYFKARQSKRAMPAEKTMTGAFKKAEKTLPRIVDGDSGLQSIAAAPMPNLPLIGAYLTVVGSLFAPLLAGAE